MRAYQMIDATSLAASLEMRKILTVCAVALCATASAWSAETSATVQADAAGGSQTCPTAVLRNGFTISYERRELAGTVMRLYVCDSGGTGYVEIPSEQIEEFQPAEIAAVPAPVPAMAAAAPPRVSTSSTVTIKDMIAGAASRHQMDPDLVTSVIRAESGFNPAAISPKGARGLMQLMPQTAASLGVVDPLDAAENVESGTLYLRQLLDRYHGDLIKALAAFNAGPERVAQYGGIPPFPETRAYVSRVIDDYERQKNHP